jgi:FtsP/CotA-like multicopper oxidase with cupredoxin domain
MKPKQELMPGDHISAYQRKTDESGRSFYQGDCLLTSTTIRRQAIQIAGTAALSAALRLDAQPAADHTLEIAPFTLEASPHHRYKTAAYNGSVPGPVIRLQEGKHVIVDVHNRTDHEEVVHWHGLFLPSDVDGAMEEGTPMIPAGGQARYVLTPRPGAHAGTTRISAQTMT